MMGEGLRRLLPWRARRGGQVICALAVLAGGLLAAGGAPLDAQRRSEELPRVTPAMALLTWEAEDQDDMAIWHHPTDLAQSTIIVSDKAADRIFVYNLSGHVVQTIEAEQPGNIDIRHDVLLGTTMMDVVAVNQRDKGPRILVFRVNPATRELERIDNDSILTQKSMGGTLYHSRRTGTLYFIVTPDGNGIVEQFELFAAPSGRVGGRVVREWGIGETEAATGDDELGKIYVAEERVGVWELGGEPGDPAPGDLVLRVRENGLRADVEGLTIYRTSPEAGYLFVSNQSRDNFQVYTREAPHQYLGSFEIEGAEETDGIDVTNANLGGRFSNGLFAAHSSPSELEQYPVLLTPFEQIAGALGLQLSTVHEPRRTEGR